MGLMITYHICYILPAPCILYLNYLHSIFELNALYIYIRIPGCEESRGCGRERMACKACSPSGSHGRGSTWVEHGLKVVFSRIRSLFGALQRLGAPENALGSSFQRPKGPPDPRIPLSSGAFVHRRRSQPFFSAFSFRLHHLGHRSSVNST